MSNVKMPDSTNHPRPTFICHVVVDSDHAGFEEALRRALDRIEPDAPARTAPARVTLVRRMTVSEVARLQLAPADGVWFEVRGLAPVP